MKKIFLLIASISLVSCVHLKPPVSAEEFAAKKKLELINKLPPPPNSEEVQKAVYGKLPNNYQEMIKEYFAIRLKDPYSAKYDFRRKPLKGYIQDLKINKGRPTFGWLVFFTYNAKNSYGAYTGSKYAQFFVFKGLDNDNYYAFPTSEYSHRYIFTETK